MKNEQKEIELKYCPFCGYKKPVLIIDEYDSIPSLGVNSKLEETIKCPSCFASTPKDVWNHRHHPMPEVDLDKLTMVVAEEYTPKNTESNSEHVRRIAKALKSAFDKGELC